MNLSNDAIAFAIVIGIFTFGIGFWAGTIHAYNKALNLLLENIRTKASDKFFEE